MEERIVLGRIEKIEESQERERKIMIKRMAESGLLFSFFYVLTFFGKKV